MELKTGLLLVLHRRAPRLPAAPDLSRRSATSSGLTRGPFSRMHGNATYVVLNQERDLDAWQCDICGSKSGNGFAGQKLKDELAIPFDKSTSHPKALVTSIYGVSKLELLKACIARELLLMDRNLIIYISAITQIVILAFITMTVFLRSKMQLDSEDNGRLFRVSLFISITFVLLNGYSEFAITASKLPIFYNDEV